MKSLHLLLVAVLVSCQPSGNMAGTLTPTVPAAYPASLTVPLNTEPLDATQESTLDQALLDGVEGARLQLYGGGIRRRVTCTSNTAMVIQPLGAIAVTTAGAWKVLAHSVVSTKNPTTMAGALAASTRYWVYAYNNAGVVDFTASTTAPDIGLRYQTGNTDYLYVSTFYTNAASTILTYGQVDAEYSYFARTTVGSGANGNLALDQGVAIVQTDIVLGPSVPTGATQYTLQVLGDSSESPANGNVINVSAQTAASTDLAIGISFVASNAGRASGQYRAPLLITTFSYNVTDAAKDTCSAWVAGFSL